MCQLDRTFIKVHRFDDGRLVCKFLNIGLNDKVKLLLLWNRCPWALNIFVLFKEVHEYSLNSIFLKIKGFPIGVI